MVRIPAEVKLRLISGLKKYQPIIAEAQSRDLSEADTSRIVTDILADVFGFDKYSENPSEVSIQNTDRNLAPKRSGQPKLLIEIKAIGTELEDTHVKQAVDYAANQGIDWVFLTNGLMWHVFKIISSKPLEKVEVVTFNVSALNADTDSDIERLFLLTKEGLASSALADYHGQIKAVKYVH